MADDKFELTRRKALAGLGTIGAASAGAGLGTSAYFNDTEEFSGNSMTAGTANLKVTAGLVSENTGGLGGVEFTDETADGSVATGLTVSDAKPGDEYIVRFTVDVTGNPMYVAAQATAISDEEHGESDPESTGSTPDYDGNPDAISSGTYGDLDNEMRVTFGWDSDRNSLHDNSIEGSITAESGSVTYDGSSGATLTQFLDDLQNGLLYRGQNGASGSPPGGHADSGDATRIGDNTTSSNVDRDKVTHFLKLEIPDTVENNIQGDSVSWTIQWGSVQVRHNSVSSASDVFNPSP